MSTNNFNLIVEVLNAIDVPRERLKKSDPYVAVYFKGVKEKTSYKKAESNPVWNEKLEFDLKNSKLNVSDNLEIQLKDHESIGSNKLLGKGVVPLGQLLKCETLKCQVELYDNSMNKLESVKLFLNIEYKAPHEVSKPENNNNNNNKIVNEEQNNLSSNIEPDSDFKLTSRQNNQKRLQKIQDFQIRIKIIEARQLFGNDINPLCCVKCSTNIKYTKIIRSTNCPYWDEIFFFNYHCSPAELFDEMIEFNIFNSLKLRKDSLIGCFKIDIGFIFDEPNHSLNRKWLLLTDSDDQVSSAKGYLKVCVNVLGPGDEIPNNSDLSIEEDDIENNLLKPPGIMLRPATLIMKLYKAEDLPRMDSNIFQEVKKFIVSNDIKKKELVDPYVLFSFAGKKATSKVLYNTANPEWNQNLKIGLNFPSLCDKIGLTLKDWDRSSKDDVISTTFINLQDISDSSENGYLPTYGPCFLNLYGGPREYSELPTRLDELNHGKSEGVAYRGRILFELKTILGELPEEPVSEINFSETLLIDLYLRRQKYKLHGVFLDATMITVIDKPIEFEVSIGNYGNKLDENAIPSSSTTPPTNAVFDGCSYYFLPWADIKPCIQITSCWEDISFRIEASNQINKLHDYIKSCIKIIKTQAEKFGNDVESNAQEIQLLATTILNMIEKIKNIASIPIVEPIPGRHISNEFDQLLYNARVKYLNQMISKCNELPRIQFKYVLEELESFCDRLKKLENDPQNSIPDVIIWMLCGNERTAYYRIPAKELFYSSRSELAGRLCGKLQTITLNWPGKINDEKIKKETIPVQVRLKLWFGLEKDESKWLQAHTDDTRNGAITIFAESYENQSFNIISRNWTNDGLSRPKFSDASGKIELNKDKFELPPNWKWSGNWEVAPELSLLFDKDDGHVTFMDEVYEQHSRLLPGAVWSLCNEDKSPYAWTDYRGEKSKNKEQYDLPANWKWSDDEGWTVDINRAVDNEGWEYCIDPSMGGWSSSEKMFHLLKRRRWIRTRIVIDKPVTSLSNQISAVGSLGLLMTAGNKRKEFEETFKEGWEYAPGFSFKFHSKEKSTDMVRRRRWHRQMRPINENQDLTATFRFNYTEKQNDEIKQMLNLTAPRMFLKYKEPQRFHLRAFIYQARSLLAKDSDTSLSDPYCKISFVTQSGKTEILKRTLSPTWDQTLIFESVNIYSDLNEILNDPPKVFIEVYDHDPYGRADFLGRCVITPKIKSTDRSENTILEWYQLKDNSENSGEILAAFDLYHIQNDIDGSFKNKLIKPPMVGSIYRVPTGIKPELQRTIIEVLCWGIRNMKSFQLLDIDCPQVIFECGSHKIESEVLKNPKVNLNFNKPALYFDIMLPKEELYAPPLTIKVIDHRHFGRKPIVGVHSLQSLAKYKVDRSKKENAVSRSDSSRSNQYIIDIEISEKEPKKVIEDDIDWWSKFYASLGEYNRCGSYLNKGYEKITIFKDELENEKKYEKFLDFCETFPLKRGKTSTNEEENETIGEFKGMFKVYSVPDNGNDIIKNMIYQNIQTVNKEECIIRVYVIRGIDLQPKDSNGKSDPYIQIINGKTKLDSRDNYIPNTNNPDFGRMFEFKTILPLHKDLCVKVKDYDLISSDEIIGETWIDLENRLLTKYRATCGLPRFYNEFGPNKWRDSQKPSKILSDICKIRNLSFIPPSSNATQIIIGDQTFNLDSYENKTMINPYAGPKGEQLCLYILHDFKLLPEHVETRKLYNPIQPGIEQGRLQMWVDIYPLSLGYPGPAFDITPRKPKSYVLRCIIWNTCEVPLDEVSISGEKMSDIYVKGWLQGLDRDKQKTDIHYRSMNGDGYFNWRLVFDFNYLPAEKLISIKKKDHLWSLDETQTKIPPILNLQIWDNDKFSADDFIGQISLNLNNMVKPVKDSDKCGLHQLNENNNNKTVSLFEQRRMKGWWPCTTQNLNKKSQIAGKIEMELELLTEEEALVRPAGKGREAPNENPKLEEPKRPDTSFLWFTSPFRSFKYVIWRRNKCGFILFFLIILLLLFIVLMIYTMPSAIWSNVIFRYLP